MMASGRSERTAELVKLSTVAGANYARKTVGSAFASDERKAELQARYELQTAEQVAEVLGNMKGAVMKLGQMASYLDGGLPEPVRQALAQMQQDAPPMSYELVAGVVRAELGGEPDTVFASFEREPMASASIGQVHRAVTHDGRAVAVKVQYPGVDAAIRADLDNSDLLFGAMGMLFSGLDPAPLVAELRDRLLEELDYRNEAENQQRFVDYFGGHPTISVPEVLHELSTGRVLCTELAYGAKWTDVLEWSQEERNLTAETLYRFAFGGIYRLGVFNGDPHPGNYLFRPGGEVTFLDFGLCKVFTPDEIAEFQRLITAMVHQDPVEVRRVSRRGAGRRSQAVRRAHPRVLLALLRDGAEGRDHGDHVGVRVGQPAAVLRPERPLRRGDEERDAAVVHGGHPAHQPRAVRPVR